MRVFACLIALCVLGLGQAAAKEKPPLVGEPAPAFELPEIANVAGAFDLKHERGHGVYINFFASWCEPCKHEVGNIEQAARSNKFGIVIVGIAVLDSKIQALAFVKAHSLTYPIAFDEAGKVGAAYRLVRLPLHVFVGPDGVIRQYVVGGPISAAELRAGLSAIAH